MKNSLILLLLLLSASLVASDREVEVTPVKIANNGVTSTIKLAVADNGNGGVLLVVAPVKSNPFYTELYAHSIRPLPDTIVVHSGKKLDTNANRTQSIDIAFDERSGKFLAVWNEFVVISGEETSSVFAQQFATNGNRIGSRKVLYKTEDVNHFAPALVTESRPTQNATYRLFFTRRDDWVPANSGVFLANLDEKGKIQGSPLLLIDDQIGHSNTVRYIAKNMFMRPNGQIVLGLQKSYYNNQNVRYDDVYSMSVNKNGSVKTGNPFFHVRSDASYTEDYVFGQASVSNFSAATLDPQEGTGGFFWRFRANQTRIKGRYRISSDEGGSAIEMVSDKDYNLYCLIQKENGILVVPFDRNGKAVMQNQIYYTFTGAKANGAYLTAAYNENYDSLMVVFQDYTQSGSPLYIAYLPIGAN